MTDILFLEMVPDAKGSEGMLTVEYYELIRRKVVIEGKSQRDVAKELGHSRKTVSLWMSLVISLWIGLAPNICSASSAGAMNRQAWL